MPFTIEWLQPDKILCVNYGQGWTDDEHFQAVEEANALIGEASKPVDVILNMGSQPVSKDIFGRGKRTFALMPTHVKRVIVVAEHDFLRLAMETFFNIYKRTDLEVIVLATMADALALFNLAELC